MPGKALKRLAVSLLLAGLVGLSWHAFKPPPEAAAKPDATQKMTFQGGSGATPANAVVIAGASDYVAVIAGEYQYLAKRFGQRGRAWRLVKQQVFQHGNKVYDLLTIEFPKGARRRIFFDITPYFNKKP